MVMVLSLQKIANLFLMDFSKNIRFSFAKQFIYLLIWWLYVSIMTTFFDASHSPLNIYPSISQSLWEVRLVLWIFPYWTLFLSVFPINMLTHYIPSDTNRHTNTHKLVSIQRSASCHVVVCMYMYLYAYISIYVCIYTQT